MTEQEQITLYIVQSPNYSPIALSNYAAFHMIKIQFTATKLCLSTFQHNVIQKKEKEH